MRSSIIDLAIADALQYGKAILKFISPNDAGTTGSHQSGYYLPKDIWASYTPHPPIKGNNRDHGVRIIWQDGRITDSCIKWYGVGSRSEYRLTGFGRNFPFRTKNNIGDLLVLVPVTPATFHAYVLDNEGDIEEIQAALNIEILSSWALYDTEIPVSAESVDECVNKRFRDFCDSLEIFPNAASFSENSRLTLQACIEDFGLQEPDRQLIEYMDMEYKLFRHAERHLCGKDISRPFESIDDFLSTAASIMNRRKSRAGRALENHVEHILRESSIPFDVRPKVDGNPDIIIPGKAQYEDARYPVSRLFIVGVKTTCKDRWRQVLNEAKRIPHKYILTMQQGISAKQLQEMHNSQVSLIVPEPIQKQYPRGTDIEMLGIDSFIDKVKSTLTF